MQNVDTKNSSMTAVELVNRDLFVDTDKNIPAINPFLYWTDSYKISHISFETKGVTEIYSNFTPRFDKYMQELMGEYYDKRYVVFGIQWCLLRLDTMARKGFFERPKEEVINEMKTVLGPYIGQEKYDHFEKLHDLGYLPIKVKALDEGTVVPVGVPFLTIRNTHPDFEWLPNYLESGLSTDIWKQLTVASVGRVYKLISDRYAKLTCDNLDTGFQNHDFSLRGQSGFESAAINGVAFLLSSNGSDNIPALWAAKTFYNSDNSQGLLAASVPAGEHSVTTSGILTEQERWNSWTNTTKISLEEAELLYVTDLLENKFQTGIFSYVADSFDYWTFVSKLLPKLKDTIMKRDGKFVVRGDSGNPEHVIAGYRTRYFTSEYLSLLDGKFSQAVIAAANVGYEAIYIEGDGYYKILKETLSGPGLIRITAVEAKGTIETLYDIFGGTVNSKGYIELDPHIGMIYGDGITVQRSQSILNRLRQRGFASSNIVFGVGSYSLNMLSRDHLGMAIKATNTIVDINGKDVDKPIFKDPKTDTSKKSAKGLMQVFKQSDGQLSFKDNCTREEEDKGLLTTVYENSNFYKLTDVFEIREKLWK